MSRPAETFGGLLRLGLILWAVAASAWADPPAQIRVQTIPGSTSLRLAGNGDRLLYGAGKLGSVYATSTGRLLTKIVAPEGSTGRELSPDGRQVATGESGQPARMHLHSADNGRLLWTFAGSSKHRGSLGAHFSPDGRRLLLVPSAPGSAPEAEPILRLLDVKTGKVVRSWQGAVDKDSEIAGKVVWNQDGHCFFWAAGRRLKVCSPASSQVLASATTSAPIQTVIPASSGVVCVTGPGEQRFSVPGLQLKESTPLHQAPHQGENGWSWKSEGGRPIVTRDGHPIYRGQKLEVVSRWLPQGGFAIPDGDGEEKYHNAAGKPTFRLPSRVAIQHPHAVGIGYDVRERQLQIYHLSDGRCLGKFPCEPAALAVDARKRILAWVGGGGIHLIDLEKTGKLRRLVPWQQAR